MKEKNEECTEIPGIAAPRTASGYSNSIYIFFFGDLWVLDKKEMRNTWCNHGRRERIGRCVSGKYPTLYWSDNWHDMYGLGNGVKPWGWSIASQLEPRARAVVPMWYAVASSSGNKEGVNLIISRLRKSLVFLALLYMWTWYYQCNDLGPMGTEGVR